jgi:BCD family chlorophyll transporter-like MFS transporter
MSETETGQSLASRMSKRAILQVALLNIAVTIVILPLDSTLNRLMINELALPATLVALLISLRFITSPLRIYFGRVSDTRPIAGRQRTWYIALGLLLMTTGFVLTPYAAYSIPEYGGLGLVFAVLAFGLLGFGVNMTTPLYFALVSDQSGEKQRPRIVAFMFIMLGVVVVIAAQLLSLALEPYSFTRLTQIFMAIAGLVAVLGVIGLFKVEKQNRALGEDAAVSEEKASLTAVRDLLLGNREALRFFVYLVLTFIAVEAQEVILEPYAALTFDMTPAETARLTAIFGVGSLLMLAVGAVIVNRIGYRSGAITGIIVGVLAFTAVIVSGSGGTQTLFLAGVFGIGMASGTLAVTNLSLMINMTSEAHAGVFLGAWGFAQAVGVGFGTLSGGILRDVGLLLSGSQTGSYLLVFGIEMVLLLLAVPLVWGLSVARFRETNRTITLAETLAAGAD